MERVLVTGANGLFGANIVRELNRRGYAVRAMVRKNSNLLSLKGADYELVRGDITVPGDVQKAVKGCDYVIHTAALTALARADFARFREVNVDAVRTIVAAAKNYGIKRFIYVGTANCFTNGTLENPGDETTGFMPWLRSNPYAMTKFMARRYVIEQAEKHGFPAIVVSPTFLIGPYDAKPSSGTLLLYAVKNRVLFTPAGGKSFTDVQNAAIATVNALTMGRIGEVYLLAGKNMTYRDFFRTVEKITRRHKILVPVSRTIINTAGSLASAAEKLLGRPLAFNATNARLLTLDNYFTGAKAEKELNLPPTDIEKAIEKAIEWFKTNGFLH